MAIRMPWVGAVVEVARCGHAWHCSSSEGLEGACKITPGLSSSVLPRDGLQETSPACHVLTLAFPLFLSTGCSRRRAQMER